MLDEDGTIIDDVIVFRLEENKYWISTLYMKELIAWLDAHKGAGKIEYKEVKIQNLMKRRMKWLK